MSYHTNTPPHDKGDVKFQLQDLAKMREMVNLVIGDMSDKFEKVRKCGNKASISARDV